MTLDQTIRLEWTCTFDDIIDDDHEPVTFQACLDAHGKYETTRFVLRLSPRNHELINSIESGTYAAGEIPSEALRAYATYMHETVHWWQHVGSTSGLLFSLSYLAQSHSTMTHLRDVLSTFGAKKSLKRWTDNVLLTEGDSAQEKLADANIAVNHALDVEYYKAYAFNPDIISSIIEENHFESVGHCYSMVYGQLVGMLSDTVDKRHMAVPSGAQWDDNFKRLHDKKHEGFYWRSPVRKPPIGLHAIYEGQARFIQLQFLTQTQKEPFSFQDWKDLGYLSGIYVRAFEKFLELSETELPEFFDDPVVSLFLLICDLAINPTRGFPLNIETFEDFIDDVDVGIRFARMCFAVKHMPHLRTAIRECSREEYIDISAQIVEPLGYDHPMTALQEIATWRSRAPDIDSLMEEHRTFRFEKMNLPLRVFFSHFLSFSHDKFERPEFFCWAGKWMAGAKATDEIGAIWLRHLSLFSDQPDKDGVYPRKWPTREEAAVRETFERFYGNMALYDLTRQWILKDGPFVCDFTWLSDNYSQEHADRWADQTFQQIYNVSLSDFEIIGSGS